MNSKRGIPIERIDQDGRTVRFRSVLQAATESDIAYWKVCSSLNNNIRYNGFKFYRLIRPAGYKFIPPVIDHTRDQVRSIYLESMKILRYLDKSGSLDNNSDLVKDLKELYKISQRLQRHYKRKTNAKSQANVLLRDKA